MQQSIARSCSRETDIICDIITTSQRSTQIITENFIFAIIQSMTDVLCLMQMAKLIGRWSAHQWPSPSANCIKIREKGLAVIQQRFDPDTKSTYWTEIDPWLCNDIYLNKGFYRLFIERSGISQDGLYPTITIRQLMWKLRMKPIPRERWETCFDRKEI